MNRVNIRNAGNNNRPKDHLKMRCRNVKLFLRISGDTQAPSPMEREEGGPPFDGVREGLGVRATEIYSDQYPNVKHTASQVDRWGPDYFRR